MTPHELYKSLPRDGSPFRIDTIHGRCVAHYRPERSDGAGWQRARFVFVAPSGTEFWHDDSPSICTIFAAGACVLAATG